METGFTEGEFYQRHFDSRAYIDNFYSDEKSLLTFVLESLSKTFSTGKYSGQRLIDVGSGPSLHSVISASAHFQEIILSDFADSNREEIQKWLRNEEGCFNWKPIIRYICEKEKKSPSEVEAELRQKVKRAEMRCPSGKPFPPSNPESSRVCGNFSVS